jgi:hypothetical protein
LAYDSGDKRVKTTCPVPVDASQHDKIGREPAACKRARHMGSPLFITSFHPMKINSAYKTKNLKEILPMT